jgi:hypothetical protein
MFTSCESLFGTDFVTRILTSSALASHSNRASTSTSSLVHLVDQCMDVYDRAVLVLKYAAETSIDDLCTALHSATVRQNRVGLESSIAGIVSGVLGIVSCATLLIASLVFGGSSAAAQTGTEVRHSHFLPPTSMPIDSLRCTVYVGIGCASSDCSATPSFWTPRPGTIAPSSSYPLMLLLEKVRRPLPHRYLRHQQQQQPWLLRGTVLQRTPCGAERHRGARPVSPSTRQIVPTVVHKGRLLLQSQILKSTCRQRGPNRAMISSSVNGTLATRSPPKVNGGGGGGGAANRGA